MEIIDYQDGMEIPATCIIRNMPNEAYHAHDSVSKSSLDLFDRSPAHYYFATPREPSRAMVIGTAIHAAILEPAEFAKNYMLLDSVAVRTASAYKEAAKIYGGDNVLTSTESANVKGMQETALANADYQKYAASAHSTELSFFGICSVTGLALRCRFDLITHDGRALDLKKTRDARPAEFSKSVFNYRYHVQHAFYSHVYKCVTGDDLKSFDFFAIEETSPHTNAIYSLCDETLELGNYYMMKNLKDYASCENPASSIWIEKETISLPSWAYSQYESDIEESIS